MTGKDVVVLIFLKTESGRTSRCQPFSSFENHARLFLSLYIFVPSLLVSCPVCVLACLTKGPCRLVLQDS